VLIDLLFVCEFLSIIYVLKFLLYVFNIFYFETINQEINQEMNNIVIQFDEMDI